VVPEYIPTLNEIEKLLEDVPGESKRSERPVIGWFCSYTPLEILLAAGLQPYRIIPSPGKSITSADGYIDRNYCPYVRTCLGEALEGRYKFLDGVIFVNSCDAMRRLYDVWRYNVGKNFIRLLDLPRTDTAEAINYFRERLEVLTGETGALFKVEVTDAALTKSTEEMNAVRRGLRQLYTLNRERGFPLTAAHLHTVVRASTSLPWDAFRKLLERLTDELPVLIAASDKRPRLLITGSVMDNPHILELIDECGARVVADDLCTGTRQFWDVVESSADPLTDLSRHYLTRTPCPRMTNTGKRFDHILRLVDEYKVDGIVFYTMKFCDPFLFDVPILKTRLERKGIPLLLLEGDYTSGTLGRVKTRVEAFVEMLRENVRVG
jgi:benzoyl-CoA reductase/2-hydroxyglutaryl-CoA dehydratase subunit BcrC/BadD/HgdB